MTENILEKFVITKLDLEIAIFNAYDDGFLACANDFKTQAEEEINSITEQMKKRKETVEKIKADLSAKAAP